MKKIILIITVLLLVGCSGLKDDGNAVMAV